MSLLNNLKISLRTDTIANWTKYNPILKKGEIAIVINESGNEQLKFGNGISSFVELKYFNQVEVKTEKVDTTELKSKSIAQGYNVKATPTSLATGIYAEADGNFGVVHGIEAKIKEGDDYSFVFNGTNLPGITDRYVSHGEGTFNINPLSGLSGFYIGEQSLQSIIDAYVNQLSNDISGKIQYGEYGNQLSSLNTLSIVTITDDDYYELVKKGQVDPTVFYNVSSVNLNAYSQRVLNVADPIANMDAANKQYVDQSFSDYYKKNETSSDTEICIALSNKIQLGDYNAQLSSVDSLSIVHIDANTYYELATKKELDPTVLYIVSSDYINAYRRNIRYVAEPILSDDAATKNYVDSISNNISSIAKEALSTMLSVKLDRSEFSDVSSTFLTAHQDISGKLNREEFSDVSSTFLTSHLDISYKLNRSEFSDVSSNFLTTHQSLSDYYVKTEVSNANELSTLFDKYQLKGNYLLSSNLSFFYDSLTKKINLNAFDGNIGQVDCTDFIKDGMLSTVELCGNILVFNFNTDAGITPISINLSSFVDNYDTKINFLSSSISTDVKNLAENYYNKTEVSNVTEIQNALNTKLNSVEFSSVSSTFLTSHQDISGKLNREEFSDVSSNFLTAHQSLSDYYKKNETSSSSEIEYAISTLSADLSDCISSVSVEVGTLNTKIDIVSSDLNTVSTAISTAISADITSIISVILSISSLVSTDLTALVNNITQISTGLSTLEISSATIDNKVDNKVKIGINNQELSTAEELSIIYIDPDSYYQKVAMEQIDDSVLYIVSADQLNAHELTIKEVATPVLSSDAANKAYIDNIYNTFNAVITQLQNKISLMEQKLSALPFTDSNGRFYMPDGINTTTGNTEYRMLSAYVEESGGALIATSDNKYIRVNDQFIEVNI